MRSPLAALVLLAIALAAPSAAGQAKSDPRVVARALADHARSLYEQGKYAEAIASLEHAESLFHAPTLLSAMARAHAAMGHLVEARALFVRVRDEKLAPNAPQPFRAAQQESAAEIQALDKRIPTLTILVRGGGGKSLRVSVDDKELRDYRPDQPVAMNPGAHRVSVVPFGGVGVTKAVDLQEGARATVEIELLGAAPAVVRAPVAAPEPPEPQRPWRLPAYLCFGIGGAFLALGAGATIFAGVKAGALAGACPSGRCKTAEQDSDIRLGKAMNVTGNVSFAVGGAGVVAATVLMLVLPRSAKPARASLALGPGTIGAQGVF